MCHRWNRQGPGTERERGEWEGKFQKTLAAYAHTSAHLDLELVRGVLNEHNLADQTLDHVALVVDGQLDGYVGPDEIVADFRRLVGFGVRYRTVHEVVAVHAVQAHQNLLQTRKT